MAHERNLENLSLDGGCLCLDFVNTLHDRTVPDPFDYLISYEDFLDWGVKTTFLSEHQRLEIKNNLLLSGKSPDPLFEKIKEHRENLYLLFLAISRDEEPSPDVVGMFNRILSRVLSQFVLKFNAAACTSVSWKNNYGAEILFFEIIKSAYELLISNDLKRVKECGSCGWLFFDKSKNNSRRWCNMQNCGSVIKAKRYYDKKKKSKSNH
jgi:predicted RNA-binding Zn ribbon-like protein